jgi:Tryptophanase
MKDKNKQSKPLLMSLVSRFLSSTTYEERLAALQQAGFNLFNLPSTMISGGDYLTDSGTGGLLDTQRAAMELADEAYAGSTSYQKFESIFKKITGFKYIFPVHQGRAAEKCCLVASSTKTALYLATLFLILPEHT